MGSAEQSRRPLELVPPWMGRHLFQPLRAAKVEEHHGGRNPVPVRHPQKESRLSNHGKALPYISPPQNPRDALLEHRAVYPGGCAGASLAREPGWEVGAAPPQPHAPWGCFQALWVSPAGAPAADKSASAEGLWSGQQKIAGESPAHCALCTLASDFVEHLFWGGAGGLGHVWSIQLRSALSLPRSSAGRAALCLVLREHSEDVAGPHCCCRQGFLHREWVLVSILGWTLGTFARSSMVGAKHCAVGAAHSSRLILIELIALEQPWEVSGSALG